MLYFVKWIEFGRVLSPILLQAVNGPCPLIAICNVLFLQGKLTLHADTTQVSFEDLSKLLQKYLEEKIQKACLGVEEKEVKVPRVKPKGLAYFKAVASPKPPPSPPKAPSPKEKESAEAAMANNLKNFDDTVRLLPKLELGLDINVIFSHPCRFEYTCEIAMFDLFDIRLLHGWVYDPQDSKTAEVLQDISYNEAVMLLATEEKEILEQKEKQEEKKEERKEERKEEKREEKGIGLEEKKKCIRNWLDDSHGQLTVFGLSEMYQVVKESELCVHFHNNHFATLYKHKEYLYSLVTDVELLRSAPQVVWMRLADVQGDDLFVDHEFKFPRKGGSRPASRRGSQSGIVVTGQPVHYPGDHQPARGGASGYNRHLPYAEYDDYRGRRRRDSEDDDEACIIL